jgi:hypothetical protein
MGNLLAALVKNFLLLRDLFGYVIPGAVLLAFAAYANSPNLSNLPLSDESIWLRAVIAITGSYVVGHVLAVIGYALYDFYDCKLMRSALTRICPRLRRYLAVPYEPPDDTIWHWYYRYLYPSMFTEFDRRDTQTILRLALSVALVIIGGLLFAGYPPTTNSLIVKCLVLVTGLFMFFNTYCWRRANAKVGSRVLEAARRAEAMRIPLLDWRNGA